MLRAPWRVVDVFLVTFLVLSAAAGGCVGRQGGPGAAAAGTGRRAREQRQWGQPAGAGTEGAGRGRPSSVVLSDGGQLVGCDGGDACMCPPFKVAVIGKPGKWGANPNGDPDTALQDWLNSSSAGTAQADNFTARPTLTADFLASYSVIILASLSQDSNTGPWWRFSADEVAAFRAWVENGGGVITLAGYSGDPGEIAPLNQLIGFSGVTYSTDGTWGTCADVPDLQLHALEHAVRVEPHRSRRREAVDRRDVRRIPERPVDHRAQRRPRRRHRRRDQQCAGRQAGGQGPRPGVRRRVDHLHQPMDRRREPQRQRSELLGLPAAGQVSDGAVLVQHDPLVAARGQLLHDRRAVPDHRSGCRRSSPIRVFGEDEVSRLRFRVACHAALGVAGLGRVVVRSWRA